MWAIVQERYLFLSIFLLFLVLSLFLLLASWKNRALLPKSLGIIVSLSSSIILVGSLLALLFILSFGYNA